MSAGTVAALLADLLGAGATSAKAANPAKVGVGIDVATESGACEGPRKTANTQPEPTAAEPDSREFAALRNLRDAPQSKYRRSASQLSQDSQGVEPTNARARPYRLTKDEGDAAHAAPWDDAACGRFVARMGLFMRRRVDATDADDLAERLHLRDVQTDDRHLCLECAHLVGRATADRTCGNANAAGLGRGLPAAILVVLQRCPGFSGVTN